MTTTLDMARLCEFVRLQKGLMTTLCAVLTARPIGLLRATYEAGSTGTIEFDHQLWTWRRHGTGVVFKGADGRVVDSHTNLFDPTEIDAWRLVTHTGFTLSRQEAEATLQSLETAGLLGVASLPETGIGTRRYRLLADHFEPETPWVSIGESGGGWIEFQRGRFDGTHWHPDSLFIDAFDSAILYPAMAVALPRFDIFTFYKDLKPDTIAMMAKALREHGLAALDDPDDEWWSSVDCAAVVAGQRSRNLALRIYDLASGLAGWLETTVHERKTLSILGA